MTTCKRWWESDTDLCDGELCETAYNCRGNTCDGFIRTCRDVDTAEAIAGGIIAVIIICVIIFCCCLPCIIFFCCIAPAMREKRVNTAKEVRKAMETQNSSQMQMNQQMMQMQMM